MNRNIVLWYIDKNVDEYPLSNFLPWKNKNIINIIKSTSNFRLDDILRERNEDLYKSLMPYENGEYLAPQINSLRHKMNVKIKYIGYDIYDDADINAFLISFSRKNISYNDMFVNPKFWPLANLPSYVINFLKDNDSCRIVYDDYKEAYPISGYYNPVIYYLGLSRHTFKLHNPIFWINASSSSHIANHGLMAMPPWLTIYGHANWLQLYCVNESGQPLEQLNSTSDISNCIRPPSQFKKGRFLMYSGRIKLSRMRFVTSIIDVLPKCQLFSKINIPKRTNLFDVNSMTYESISSGIRNAIEVSNEKNNLISDYRYPGKKKSNIFIEMDESELDNIARTYSTLPIDTFPKEMNQTVSYLEDAYIHVPNQNVYKNIFIELVSETISDRNTFGKNNIFITEKVARPIRACRPFIVFADAGYYRELKDLGFKTFDRWWDESYDDDISSEEALVRIRATVSEISSWSDDKCERVFNEMYHVLSHNRTRLDRLCSYENDMRLQSIVMCDKNFKDRPEPKWYL